MIRIDQQHINLSSVCSHQLKIINEVSQVLISDIIVPAIQSLSIAG